jgi:rubrerythrin
MNIRTEKERMILFFDSCARIEGMCAELYHFYSDLFQSHEEVSQLWKKTALEEENHQKQFELAGRLRDVADFFVEADLERTYRVFNKLQILLKHVRNNNPDMVTAFSNAIEMEERLTDLHMESSVRFGNNSIKELFKAMRDFDQDHVKSLKHCLAILMLPKADMAG